MTDRIHPALTWSIRAAIAGILVIALWPLAPRIGAYVHQVGFHPHWPDLSLVAALSLQIQLHIVAAVTAFLIGVVILAQPKGSRLHKSLGWAWVIAMATTAISSLFITGLNGNAYSLIHLISGWTIVALPAALFAIRNKRVQIHKRLMVSLFIGGPVIAGALTFIPGRLMYQLFFG